MTPDSFLFTDHRLTLSKTSPGFYVSAVQVFLKTPWEKEKLLVTSNFSFFSTVFSIRLGNFMSFSSNLKSSSEKSFSLEEPKICRLGNRFKHCNFFTMLHTLEWYSSHLNEPYPLKRGLNAFEKSISPAQSKKADMGRNFSLS